MLLRALRGALVLAATAVAVPYAVALMSNVLYGWPQTKHKYRRALHPKKVLGLNYCLLQKLCIMGRYLPLYLKWKRFYSHANPKNVRKNLVYGRNDCTLDVYLPTLHRSEAPTPVVVFVYGGAWSSGDKDMYGLLCSHVVANTGAAVVCPNYSTYPKGYVDDMIQDVVDCVSWVIENIEQYGGDKDKIILLGHSAGAHLSAMAIVELLYDERVSVEPFFRFQPAGGHVEEELAFSDSHYGRLNLMDRRREGLEDSSGSSESFAVVSENGTTSEQGGNNGGLESSGASTGLLGSSINTDSLDESNISETGLSASTVLVSAEDALGDKSSGPGVPQEEDQEAKADLLAAGDGETSHKPEEQKKSESSSRASGSVGDEEEEESGEDDDSVVTVKPKDIERIASLADVCKSVKAFIGLAGVYSIKDHFQHESMRGIEDLSCMCRAHYGQDHFERFSPTEILHTLGRCLSLPLVVLVHGTEDYTTPVSASQKFAEALASCSANVKMKIIPDCDHYEVCLDLMESNRKFYSTVMGIIMEAVSAVS